MGEYFDELFDGEQENVIGDTTITPLDENRKFMRKIQKSEVDMALKNMKLKKRGWPDGIPIEVWRCLVTIEVTWIIDLFNKI